jgi:molybdate transport system substrate-binding protein
MHLLYHLLVTALFSLLLLNPVRAEEVHAAVASNFTAPMKQIVEQFEQSSGHDVTLSFGSSGKIFAQIQNGAPFQVFLSADQQKPEALEKKGLTVPGSRFTYAVGSLALWSARPDFVDDDYTRLKQGEFNKLALANPKLAPYGAAAVEVLSALKLREATQPKWIMGENIAQTYQFVDSGNADLGLVALSQIMHNGKIKKGSGRIIPGELHNPIRQDAVLLSNAQDRKGAQALLAYLRSDKAHAIMRAFGYTTE